MTFRSECRRESAHVRDMPTEGDDPVVAVRADEAQFVEAIEDIRSLDRFAIHADYATKQIQLFVRQHTRHRRDDLSGSVRELVQKRSPFVSDEPIGGNTVDKTVKVEVKNVFLREAVLTSILFDQSKGVQFFGQKVSILHAALLSPQKYRGAGEDFINAAGTGGHPHETHFEGAS